MIGFPLAVETGYTPPAPKRAIGSAQFRAYIVQTELKK
jgi:hypothetical protein